MSSSIAHATPVRVLIPDRDNLQYMAFWVAKGAGFFSAEGIDVELSIPSAPAQTPDYFRRGDADVAVLPPPMYLDLIAEKQPIVLVANLLQNDPINLVVRRSVMDERKLSTDLSVEARLKGLKGLKVGVAPNPPKRLRALFASVGMDADRDIEMVILHGPEQNYAFGDHRVDALYAHTPYLETALVTQDAVMLVNQSDGDVPLLATRQIHALVVRRAFADASAPLVTAMTRAIYHGEQLIHDEHAATVDALLHEFPTMDKKLVDKIVTLYEPAVPLTPRVSAQALPPALALYPASKTPPSLDGIDLAAFVAPRFAEQVVKPSRSRFIAAGAAFAVALVWTAFVVVARRKRARVKPAPG